MDSLLLSRITKDFLNQDESLPSRDRYRMGWSGSVLSTHPQAEPKRKKAVSSLIAIRERFSQLFDQGEIPEVPLSTAPRLRRPIDLPPTNFRPPKYFSRGALENVRRRNPEPIPYLLTETHETAQPRPVPGNSLLFRSLCRGKGILSQNGQGLTYLDVDNRFISMLLPYLKGQGLVRPPYFNLFGSPEGAHIPLIPAREAAFQYLGPLQELGREFSFEIEGLYSMKPASWPEVEQVWFFKVHSQELEDLRRKYFLPALPGGHSFHIAVAVKTQTTLNQKPNSLPLMRINVAYLAA
jgi:hypothetical protein